MLRKLKLRLRALFHRNEIGDEINLHLEQLTNELISQGLSPREAATAAKRQFGSLTRIQEQSYDLFSFRLPARSALRLAQPSPQSLCSGCGGLIHGPGDRSQHIGF